MCGIFAAVSLGSDLSFNLPRMLAKAEIEMSSRGPDNIGYYFSQNRKVFLLHSRLAIQNLHASGSQPFLSSSGDVLIYNGEIYNTSELSASYGLNNKDGDTPLFSRILSENSIDSIKDIKGMFSFVNYSESANVLTYGRDLFGEKPLFTYRSGDMLFLFSESRFLRLASLVCPIHLAINTESIIRLLLYGYRQVSGVLNGFSFYKDVSSIKAGEIHKLDLNNGYFHCPQSLNTRVPLAVEHRSSSTRPDINELRELLLREISICTSSEVNTAVSLSAGIDSNVVASILCKTVTPPRFAYTLYSRDARYSESEIASRASSFYNIIHKNVFIEDFDIPPLQNLIKLSALRGNPFLTTTSFVSWYIGHQAKTDGVKVVYSGIGGDELFGGYYDHYFHRRFSADYSLHEASNYDQYIKCNVRNIILQQASKGNLSSLQTFDHHYLELNERIKYFHESIPLPPPSIYFYPFSSYLRSRMEAELFSEVVPVVLHEDDLNYMSNSVENRSPLLSANLYNYARSLNDKDLFFDGFQKWPMRAAVQGIVPDFVRLNRKKVGFNFSTYDMFTSEKELLLDLLGTNTLLWSVIDKSLLVDSIEQGLLSEAFLFTIIAVQAFLIEKGGLNFASTN
jgi:asparagine synthase (glutamine-hydrolysing)